MLTLASRRDGTPFINLLMCAPLYDDKGIVRYFIGAQVDVTGLVQEGMGIESFRTLLQNDRTDTEKDSISGNSKHHHKNNCGPRSLPKEALARLQELSVMFSQEESDVVNKNSRVAEDMTDTSSIKSGVPTSIKQRSQARRIIGDEAALEDGLNLSQLNIRNGDPSPSLPGVYKHVSYVFCLAQDPDSLTSRLQYILVRPHPSLQIIFVSPSLRLPGLLRTHLFSKLGGSSQTIAALEDAFRDGAAVTAKVLWLPKTADRGRGPAEARPRWIRCTPLLGSDDRVGVWMIIIVPVEEDNSNGYRRREHVGHMVDEMEAERRKLDAMSKSSGSLRAQSVDREYDRGFGLKKRGPRSNTSMREGRGDDDSQLYAEYLRGSLIAGHRSPLD